MKIWSLAVISLVIIGLILPNAFSQPVPNNGIQFNLKINDTFTTDSLKIRLLNVTSDSRCPANVYCIWQGEATTLLDITQNNQSSKYSLSTISNHDKITFGKYTLSLVNVSPLSTGKKISSNDYVITLIISATLDSPLRQFKSGIFAKNIQCKNNLILVLKAQDGSPACVTAQTSQKLVDRGWAKSIRI